MKSNGYKPRRFKSRYIPQLFSSPLGDSCVLIIKEINKIRQTRFTKEVLIKNKKKKLLFGRVLSCTNFVLKQRALHSTSKQLTEKKEFVALRFLERTLHDPLPPLHDQLTLYMNLLHSYPLLTLWALGITTFSLTKYYPPGLRYYHLQPYSLPPPLGFKYYHLQPNNPFNLMFLPAIYIGGVKMSPKCGTVYFVCRASHSHFICC